MEDDTTIADAIEMVLGADEDIPPYVDPELMEQAAISLATWVFGTFEERVATATDEEKEDVFPNLVSTAIAAAYLAGALDATNQPTVNDHATPIEVAGKKGHITININVT
jgi:hypothetical protein